MDNNENKSPKRKEINLWVLVLILVVLLAVIILAIIGLNKLLNKDKNKSNEIQNEVVNATEQLDSPQNNEDVSNEETQSNETESSSEEIETPATENQELQLTKYEISDENIVTIFAGIDDFEDGKKLSVEKYLKVAYLALKEDLVKIPGKNNKASTVTYTELEVKSLIYSLFDIKLAENMSIGENFTYENGVYSLKHSDRGADMPIVKNVGDGAADGTKILMYDVYKNIEGTEKLEGSYMIGISGDDGFVVSKKKSE